MTTLSSTTRRHPRTLSEAFPDERAEWFEPPTRPAMPYMAVSWALAVAVIAIITSICFQGPP